MTRQEKTAKRKARAVRRKERRNNKWRSICESAYWEGVPTAAIRKPGHSWADSNSPTGFSQKCSYRGICQSPCNGDC